MDLAFYLSSGSVDNQLGLMGGGGVFTAAVGDVGAIPVEGVDIQGKRTVSGGFTLNE